MLAAVIQLQHIADTPYGFIHYKRSPVNRNYDPTPPLPSEYRHAAARASKPKDAATLIVVRQRRTAEILMGRRAASHKFMPNKFVFPGGKLDIADQRLNLNSSLSPETLNRLRKFTQANTSDKKITGLALAAIRETFEETGLVVGRRVHGKMRSKNSSWQAYFDHEVEPALDAIEFIARAITPTYRVRRFNTRFFMVSEESTFINQNSLDKQSGELEQVRWIPLSEIRELDLPGVTRWVLDEVEKRLMASTKSAPSMPTPFVQFVRGTTLEKLL